MPPTLKLPRDGDGDGRIFDSTPDETAAPPKVPGIAHPPGTYPVATDRTRDGLQSYREFGDAPAIRRAIYDQALEAASKVPPITNQRHSLSLHDVAYEGPEDYSLADQKRAILEGGTLGRRMKGTWRLSDLATGQVLSEKRTTLASVPYMSPRGTFIIGGNEYTLAHQFRLRAGNYARVKDNGEIEAHVNILPGQGLSHRIGLEPETGRFTIEMGQAAMPLIPLLRAMGVKDQQLRDAWGQELAYANMLKDDPRVIDKLAARLLRGQTGLDAASRKAALAAEFAKMPLDPEVTRRTLGHPYDRVTADALLAATKKLLQIARKEVEPDDRDHLAYMMLYGPEDLIAERVGKDRMLLGKFLWKAGRTGSIDHIPASALNKGIQAAILGSGLGQPGESINPVMIFDQQGRVSRLGTGGIPSLDSVPEAARDVQPSHFGFVDPVVTPECFDALTCVLTASGWKRWPDVVAGDRLACLIDGEVRYERPLRLIVADYDGPMIGMQTKQLDYLVTPNHRLWNATTKKRDVRRFDTAEALYERRRRFPIKLGVVQAGHGSPTFSIPRPPKLATCGRTPQCEIEVPMAAWCCFLGWYLAEGWAYVKVKPKGHGTSYRVTIAQSPTVNPEKCRQIAKVLSLLPWRWRYSYKINAFVIDSKHLAYYLVGFGKSRHKYIPRYVFDQSVAIRQGMLDALMQGDGTKDYRYTTSSHRLALDVHELACSLGYTASICPMSSPSHVAIASHRPRWRVNVRRSGKDTVLGLRPSDYRTKKSKVRGHYREHYKGKVYCAEVPGGLLYVMRNGKAMWSGNSLAVGVDSRVARGARKGPGHRMYAQFIDARTGRKVWKTPQELADAVIAFPGSLASGKAQVPALVGGKTRFVDKRQVQFELPHFEDAFSPLTNLVPMKGGVKPQRAVMAGRMISQALPVLDPESPHVQSAVPGGLDESFEEHLGPQMGALRSSVAGEVVKITPDEMHVRTPEGLQKFQLYNNFVFNRKTALHQTPLVAVGDRVEKGQLLARSNYTDEKGATALGKNARVAYIPTGDNFEDALVVSESFAKRMTSQHMYQHTLEHGSNGVRPGRDIYLSVFPGRITGEQLQQYDDDGVVKPGTVLQPDQPVVLAIKQRERHHGTLHKGRTASFSDASEVWKHHSPGVVTDVARTKGGFLVTVQANNPLDVGDKLSGRMGDKGVVAKLLHDDEDDGEPNDLREVTRIVPDDEMPRGEDGRPFEVLLNPLGIISRVNPSQMVEAALGKIAERTGRKYKVPDFGKVDDFVAFAQQELAKNGLSATETVTDPQTGRKIPKIYTGNRFIMKLHHTAESKGQGRGTAGYTAEGLPAKGGEAGSKLVSLMDVHALLSHGATEVIRDAGAIRGQAHPEFWAQFMAGYDPPLPKVPPVYEKFLDQLRGAGLNPVRSAQKTHLLALTNRGVDELAGDRELQNAETVDWKDLQKPIKGGLFDETLTGGHGGNRWAAIRLHEPMPNPAMEDPIRRMLDLTEKEFREVLAGRRELRGRTGPGAIRGALEAINVDREIEHARQEINSGKKTHRDVAVRKLGYLKAAQKHGLHPRDWVLDRVPVLPPRFRPVSLMQGSKLPMIADPNMLYKELLDANSNLKDMSSLVDDVGDERTAVYDAFKAVVGLGDPLHPKNRERQVKGILKHVFGNSPKTGTVQRKLISSPTDLVGRAVISPDPNLEMDQIGVPEARAWEVYQPFIVRRLVRRGMPRLQALREVKERGENARKAMLAEMEVRPIVTNRAPTLHRYSIMAFKPVLTKGETLRLPPLVYKGFGADNDGDAMQYHVLGDEAAAKEAFEKMLPSRNLFSVSEFKAHQVPSQEYIAGLFSATAGHNAAKRARVMVAMDDVVRAYQRGELNVDDPVEVVNH